MSFFQCHICKKATAEIFRNVHHIWPRALGGDDSPENLVALCSGCHDNLHAIAYKLLSKKPNLAMIEDSLRIAYEDLGAVQRCKELASKVRDATIKTRESRTIKDEHKMFFSLSSQAKLKLEVFCKSRKISQEKAIRFFVENALSKIT